MASEDSKAIGEVAKATSEIVKAAGGLGSYLARVIGSIPEDLLGLMVGDWLQHKRRRHLAVLEVGTTKILQGIHSDRITEPSPSVLIPLLEAAVDEGREEIQSLWAGLLANAMVDSGSKIRRSFFEVVRALEPIDAIVLNIIRNVPPKADPRILSFEHVSSYLSSERIRQKISQRDFNLSLQALTKLGCTSIDGYGTPSLAEFGAALLDACDPPSPEARDTK